LKGFVMASTAKIVAGNDVRHGRLVVGNSPVRAEFDYYGGDTGREFEQSTPNPTTIGTKYDNRFDDPTYYTA
jgi:hypothetical protein